MKKLWVFLLLFLFSCQPDELMVVEPYPQYEMVFEETESSVTDGQEISFEILVEEKHWLIISDEETNSVVAKESFLPLAGLNTRKIYTKSLPKKKLQLTLETSLEILKSTYIVVN
jgi:hypothetical protein